MRPKLQLTSPAFPPAGTIPSRYTCDGEDLSPPLAWTTLPARTASLVLLVEDQDPTDPDRPGAWVQWVVYNIPPTVRALTEGASRRGLPSGALPGRNDFGLKGYGGPCPPSGCHRYVHRLYALDRVLPDLKGPSARELLTAMSGHVLEAAVLEANYARPAP